jgi:peptidoglycan/LPS O-acetylase OafA/YrhL
MQVLINDGAHQTALFSVVFCFVFLFSFLVKKNYTSFSLTQELKGFAMLTIIFAHIGYALSTDPAFLFPFSILSGVGVNLFLFLSGYGLTFSQLRKEDSLLNFYKRRLVKLFIPFWIVLVTFLTLDFFVLGKTYTIPFLLQSFFGIFIHADVQIDFNSPFWYFSYILFFYLLFPIVFSKRYPWISAIILYLIVWKTVQTEPLLLKNVISLYEVHMLAFPLGIIGAWLMATQQKTFESFKTLCSQFKRYAYIPAVACLLAFVGYFAIHANVGAAAYLEERTSIAIMFALILLFAIKKRESKLFSLFGLYSYEIYLFHWPLLYRYDFLYINLPAWVATLLYLGVFIALAKLLHKLSSNIVVGTGL